MEKSIFTTEQRALQLVLRQLRLSAGLTQQELAERLAEPQSFISKIESGERRLDFVELWHVCGALEIDFADLVKRFKEQLHACNRTPNS